jgi:hypothetical protein
MQWNYSAKPAVGGDDEEAYATAAAAAERALWGSDEGTASSSSSAWGAGAPGVLGHSRAAGVGGGVTDGFTFDVTSETDGLLAFVADPRVEDWLGGLGLEKYSQLFIAAEVVSPSLWATSRPCSRALLSVYLPVFEPAPADQSS